MCDITIHALRDEARDQPRVMCRSEQSGSSHHIKGVIYVKIQDCLPGKSASTK